MDVLYEESAVNAHAEKAQKRYKILNIFSKLFGVIALVIAVIFFFNLLILIFSATFVSISLSFIKKMVKDLSK